MIAGIHGSLRTRSHDHVVVGVGGFDVRVFVSTSTLSQMGAPDSQVDLFTHLYLHEDVMALYGFRGTDELKLFELLLTVSGVGPRVALMLLSTLTPEALRTAIAREDAVALSRAPGVGKKLASRIILELKSRFGTERQLAGPGSGAVSDDLLDALMAMGLTAGEAQQLATIGDVAASQTIDEQLTRALQHYAARRR